MVALSELLGGSGGGALPPVNGSMYLIDPGPLVDIDGAVFLRSGFVETDAALYPAAQVSALTVDQASYDGVSFAINGQTSFVHDMIFKPDGTKMYVCGIYELFQYSLVSPWDISTAVYDNVSINVTAQNQSAEAFFFKPDGTKMYMLGGNSADDSVYQYSLATPWDVSTAVYDGITFSVYAQDANVTGLFFKPDGAKMYVLGDANNSVYQYSLATPWDLSTAANDGVSFAVGVNGNGLFFDSTGTEMFVCDGSRVRQFDLSSPWDLGTAAFEGASLTLDASSTSYFGVFMKPDGSKMFTVSSNSPAVHAYSRPHVVGAQTGVRDGKLFQYVRVA